jgi:hypothetical protein
MKLGLRDRAQAVIVAYERGVASPRRSPRIVAVPRLTKDVFVYRARSSARSDPAKRFAYLI